MLSKKSIILYVASAALVAAGQMANAAVTWDPFIIRDSSSTGNPATDGISPVITETGNNNVTANITLNGQKAGYGTSYFDGKTLSALQNISYTRVDSGPHDPYLNIWITDGINTATIAPLPGALNGGGYSSTDFNGLNLQTLGFGITNNSAGSDYSWLGIAGAIWKSGTHSLLHADGTPILVSEIDSLMIGDPNSVNPDPGAANGVGDTGAPKHGTGFNLIFGDTQGDYTTPIPYQLENITVPEPTSAAVLGLGVIGLLMRRRRTVQ